MFYQKAEVLVGVSQLLCPYECIIPSNDNCTFTVYLLQILLMFLILINTVLKFYFEHLVGSQKRNCPEYKCPVE